jgi:PAS domain S-box-containing protein
MPVPVYTWQRSGKDFVLVDHNDAADAITGGRMSDYLGTTARAMYPGRPDILEDMSRCYAEKISIQKEMVYRFKTTEEDKTLVVKYAYVPPDLVLVHTEDITERKQVEQALRKSEQAYRNLVEKISDVIYAIDTAGVTTYVSPAIESFLGFSVEQVVGQPFARFLAPEDLGQSKDSFQVLMSGVSPGPAEYRVRTSSGETRWMRVSSQPIVDGGRVSGVQGVLTDITERKRVEEQLEEAAAAAERQRLARELHDAVTQTLFAASLMTETLPTVWDRNPQAAREGLEQLRSWIRGALAELRIMLLELRPDALPGKPLDELIRQLGDGLMARTKSSVTTTVVGECSLPTEVNLSLYRIAQEALNNVAKHAQASQVQVRLTCEPGHVTLEISDDGWGFNPDQIKSGQLGLGIMQERATAISAELILQSQHGEGTTVTVIWQDAAGKEQLASGPGLAPNESRKRGHQ